MESKKMSDEIRLVSELSSDIYRNNAGKEIALVKIENNVLMTAKEIAKLYGVQRPAIYKQLKDIYKNKQLIEKEVSSILTHRAEDGKLYRTKYYTFQVVVAVGKKLKSVEAIGFMEWLGVDEHKRIVGE